MHQNSLVEDRKLLCYYQLTSTAHRIADIQCPIKILLQVKRVGHNLMTSTFRRRYRPRIKPYHNALSSFASSFLLSFFSIFSLTFLFYLPFVHTSAEHIPHHSTLQTKQQAHNPPSHQYRSSAIPDAADISYDTESGRAAAPYLHCIATDGIWRIKSRIGRCMIV